MWDHSAGKYELVSPCHQLEFHAWEHPKTKLIELNLTQLQTQEPMQVIKIPLDPSGPSFSTI